jgi:hypothetical protein
LKILCQKENRKFKETFAPKKQSKKFVGKFAPNKISHKNEQADLFSIG